MKRYFSPSKKQNSLNKRIHLRKLKKKPSKIDGEKERQDYRKYLKSQETLKTFNYKDLEISVMRSIEKQKDIENLRKDIYKSIITAFTYEQLAEGKGALYPLPEDTQKFITEESMKNWVLALLEYITKYVLMDELFFEQLGVSEFLSWGRKEVGFLVDIFNYLDKKGYIDEEFIDFFKKGWSSLPRKKKIIQFTILADLAHHSGNILRDFLGFLYTDDLKKWINDLERVFV